MGSVRIYLSPGRYSDNTPGARAELAQGSQVDNFVVQFIRTFRGGISYTSVLSPNEGVREINELFPVQRHICAIECLKVDLINDDIVFQKMETELGISVVPVI
jgi:hypothetical protein